MVKNYLSDTTYGKSLFINLGQVPEEADLDLVDEGNDLIYEDKNRLNPNKKSQRTSSRSMILMRRMKTK